MSCGRCSSPVNRTVIVFALFLGAITGAIGSAQAAGQSAPVERTFKKSKDDVAAAVKELHSSASGRLPVLDGFVDAPDESLSHYERGFFQCEVQVTAAGAGATVVRVTAKITAWYADSSGANAGYRELASNGRIEGDYLDRLEARLGGGAAVAATRNSKASGSGSPPSHSAKTAASKESAPAAGAGSPGDSTAGSIAGSSHAPQPDAASADDPPAPAVPAGESLDAIRKRVEVSEKQVKDLNGYLQNLEQIKKDQSHPADLAVVKKGGAPVVSKPQRDAEVLFSAAGDDEFQILDLTGAWVHVQISGESRGWIRRTLLDLPAGYVPSGGSKAAEEPSDADDLFHVTREETSAFAGEWEALKGKTVKLFWVAPNSTDNQLTSPHAKREYAKTVLLNAYTALGSGNPEIAGVVVVFDSIDGGQIAATRASLEQLKTIAPANELAFWKQCSLDPPDAFLDKSKP
jgi:hypothetical protein